MYPGQQCKWHVLLFQSQSWKEIFFSESGAWGTEKQREKIWVSQWMNNCQRETDSWRGHGGKWDDREWTSLWERHRDPGRGGQGWWWWEAGSPLSKCVPLLEGKTGDLNCPLLVFIYFSCCDPFVILSVNQIKIFIKNSPYVQILLFHLLLSW